MKNRDFKVGRQVKLPRQKQAVPDNFISLLIEAKEDGEDFGPKLIELSKPEQAREMYRLRDKYRRLSCKRHGTNTALLAMFNFALAELIFANREQEEYWLVGRAIHSSILAQNQLAAAFLALDRAGRMAFYESWRKLRLPPEPFHKFCQSSLASARFAYAAMQLGAKVRFASIENDMHSKIDFFVDDPMSPLPTLCVQIKSSTSFEGTLLTALRARPLCVDHDPQEYMLHKQVFDGVAKFNHQYNRDWLAVVVVIGMNGANPEQIIDYDVIQVISSFLEDPERVVHLSCSEEPDCFPLQFERACA